MFLCRMSYFVHMFRFPGSCPIISGFVVVETFFANVWGSLETSSVKPLSLKSLTSDFSERTYPTEFAPSSLDVKGALTNHGLFQLLREVLVHFFAQCDIHREQGEWWNTRLGILLNSPRRIEQLGRVRSKVLEMSRLTFPEPRKPGETNFSTSYKLQP